MEDHSLIRQSLNRSSPHIVTWTFPNFHWLLHIHNMFAWSQHRLQYCACHIILMEFWHVVSVPLFLRDRLQFGRHEEMPVGISQFAGVLKTYVQRCNFGRCDTTPGAIKASPEVERVKMVGGEEDGCYLKRRRCRFRREKSIRWQNTWLQKTPMTLNVLAHVPEVIHCFSLERITNDKERYWDTRQ